MIGPPKKKKKKKKFYPEFCLDEDNLYIESPKYLRENLIHPVKYLNVPFSFVPDLKNYEEMSSPYQRFK